MDSLNTSCESAPASPAPEIAPAAASDIDLIKQSIVTALKKKVELLDEINRLQAMLDILNSKTTPSVAPDVVATSSAKGICSTCQKSGHRSTTCTEKCFICNNSGHCSKECTLCKYCKEIKHPKGVVCAKKPIHGSKKRKQEESNSAATATTSSPKRSRRDDTCLEEIFSHIIPSCEPVTAEVTTASSVSSPKRQRNEELVSYPTPSCEPAVTEVTTAIPTYDDLNLEEVLSCPTPCY